MCLLLLHSGAGRPKEGHKSNAPGCWHMLLFTVASLRMPFSSIGCPSSRVVTFKTVTSLARRTLRPQRVLQTSMSATPSQG